MFVGDENENKNFKDMATYGGVSVMTLSQEALRVL
jgi:hypothetical protein